MTRQTKTETTTKRARRSADEIVADLQREIERVKARAAAQQARADPGARALIAAARFLDRSAESCTGDSRRALEAARAILGEQLAAMGVRLPQRRTQRQVAA